MAATQTPPERTSQLWQHATTWWRENLTAETATWASQYLANRGLDVFASSRLGYAPPGWQTTIDHLRSQSGATDLELLDAGLARRSRRGSLIDVLRDRVTIEITDATGRPVGATGRRSDHALGPKYMDAGNLRGTWIGLGPSEAHALSNDGAIAVLVEGPMDAIAVAQAARHSPPELVPLAAGGATMSKEQLAQLNAIVPPSGVIATMFDNDRGGQAATDRAWKQLSRSLAGRELTALDLPVGTNDPAEAVGQNRAHELITSARHPTPLLQRVIAQTVDQVGPAEHLGVFRAMAVARHFLPEVARTAQPAPILIDLAHRLNLDPTDLASEWAEYAHTTNKETTVPTPPENAVREPSTVATVYTTPNCVQCRMTTREMAKFGISFSVVDLSADAAAHRRVTEELGYFQAPVVQDNRDPDRHWSGFRPDKIRDLATSEVRAEQQQATQARQPPQPWRSSAPQSAAAQLSAAPASGPAGLQNRAAPANHHTTGPTTERGMS